MWWLTDSDIIYPRNITGVDKLVDGDTPSTTMAHETLFCNIMNVMTVTDFIQSSQPIKGFQFMLKYQFNCMKVTYNSKIVANCHISVQYGTPTSKSMSDEKFCTMNLYPCDNFYRFVRYMTSSVHYGNHKKLKQNCILKQIYTHSHTLSVSRYLFEQHYNISIIYVTKSKRIKLSRLKL